MWINVTDEWSHPSCSLGVSSQGASNTDYDMYECLACNHYMLQ